MDAYSQFDRKHEEHPDTRDVEEREEWKREHDCDKDRLAVIHSEPVQLIACCSVCFFKYWTHEGARINTTFKQAA